MSNGGHTTQYFSLSRGARQGDPIAAYLFIIVLEIFFVMIRSNTNIHPLRIMDFVFLLTAYADDTTFFVADLSSVNEIFSTFNEFSMYSGMSINTSKCELAGIGVKKSVVPVLCGVKVVSLCKDSIRVLGVHFTYCQKLFMDRNYVDSICNDQMTIREGIQLEEDKSQIIKINSSFLRYHTQQHKVYYDKTAAKIPAIL